MTTPICDFAAAYEARRPVRMHMPGHKTGSDLTEIPGADVLYRARGIIRESEENAAALFGARRTLYSTEGSSLCIRAMLQLVRYYAELAGKPFRIAAGRNAHRVFLDTAALLDPEIRWFGGDGDLLESRINLSELEAIFADPQTRPAAVYVTSPDYLGNLADLRPIASLCHQNGALLLVDNAHGAYLKFLEKPLHPLDLGADLCCDSAHKTLSVLTGGAYLHASESCPEALLPMMERAMAMFASTSPSYLILQSLDRMNALLAGDYPERIREVSARLQQIREKLRESGWKLTGTEPMKLSLCPKNRGYTGQEVAKLLERENIFCEFADPDYVVLMPSAESGEEELQAVYTALQGIEKRKPLLARAPKRQRTEPLLSLREVLGLPFETVPVSESPGRILASPSVSCPPAVPILICGERIDDEACRLFEYYGVDEIDVLKKVPRVGCC